MKRKLKRWEKILTGALMGVFLLAAGFMGIEQFSPERRSLDIFDEASTVSGTLTAEEAETTDVSDGSGEKLKIDAKAAVLIDGSSGKVLFAQNEKEHLPPASVTKVMTLLLIFEGCESGKISFDDKVTVSERAADMGGSQMYMEPGEQHTVEELLKGVIMVSANDGCAAIKTGAF